MDEASAFLNEEIPAGVAKFLTEVMTADEKTIQFFQTNSLITARDIVQYGTKPVETILTEFPIQQILDEDFVIPIAHTIFLASYLTEIGEELQSKDTPLLSSATKPYWEYLPNSENDTNKLMQSIDPTKFNRSTRHIKRQVIMNLQEAVNDIVNNMEDPFLGKTISTPSGSFKGGFQAHQVTTKYCNKVHQAQKRI